MHIYEPIYLAFASVEILVAIVFLAVGIIRVRRINANMSWLIPFFLQLALASVVQAIAMISSASEEHQPSIRTLVLFAFAGGVLAATLVSTGLSLWIRRQSRRSQ